MENRVGKLFEGKAVVEVVRRAASVESAAGIFSITEDYYVLLKLNMQFVR